MKKKQIFLLLSLFLIALISNAQELKKGSIAYYESLRVAYQTKIDWVQNNPEEHILAQENNWYSMANANVEKMEAYKLLAEQSSNQIYLPNHKRTKSGGPEAGGDICEASAPLCLEYENDLPCGANGASAEEGPDYGCLSSEPNPTWYFIQVVAAGDIILELTADSDVDYIIWGPFSEVTCDYDELSEANIVDCSYSSSNTETPEIGPGSSGGPTTANVGEYYMFMVTNFSNQIQDFTLVKTGGEGTTFCGCWCSLDLTLNIGDCEPHQTDTGYYSENDITGYISYVYNLVFDSVAFSVDDSVFQVLTTNLISPLHFTLNNHLADGDWHDINGEFYLDGNLIHGPSDYFTTTNCASCEANAGPDIMGHIMNTEASISPNDFNPSWQALCEDIVFSNNHLIDTEVSYNGSSTDSVFCDLVWTITNYMNLTCSDTISATFIPFPLEPVFIDTTAIACFENSTFLSVVDFPSYIYHWDLPEGWQGESDSSSIVFYNDGLAGSVSVTAESIYGMGNTSTLSYTIMDYPIADFSYTFKETELTLINNSEFASSYLWDFGDSTLSKEIDPVHIYTENGAYLVKIYAENFCGIDSNFTNILVSGIGIDEIASEKLKLYPNPSNGIVNISGLQKTDKEIEVLDITGRVLMTKRIINSESTHLDLSDFKEGIYQLLIDRAFSRTIVIKK